MIRCPECGAYFTPESPPPLPEKKPERVFPLWGCIIVLAFVAAVGLVVVSLPRLKTPKPPPFTRYTVVLYSTDNVNKLGGDPGFAADDPRYMTVALWARSGGKGNARPIRIPDTGDGVPATVLDRQLLLKTKDPWLYVQTLDLKTGWIAEAWTQKTSR
jgi:hypothetical protein